MKREERLSSRHSSDLLAQRGITVTYETIRQWCLTFGPTCARTLRRRQGRLGDTWYLDELFVKIQGSADISGEPWTRTVTSSTSSSSRGGIGERPCASFARC